jgi:DNA invertase Pin-like site-specific DNA recombinase
VYKLDRLGRSLTHLALILDELQRLGIPLISSSQGIDTSESNPAGRLQLAVLAAVAEFERGIIRERVNAGLAAARQRGVTLGRPVKIRARVEEVRVLKAQGFGLSAIARQLRMPVSSVFKAMKLAGDGAKTEAAPAADQALDSL